MRGSSSMQRNYESEGVITDNNLPNVVEEAHLSGAYIRNLVKQLTSFAVKDSMNQKEHLGSSLVFDRPHEFPSHHQNLGSSLLFDRPHEFPSHHQNLEESQEERPQSPQQRKQPRRRLLTTSSYQEDLDTAEAKREIVMALRLHRASMKQTSDNHPQPSNQIHSKPLEVFPQPQQELKSKSRRNSRNYYSNTTSNFSNTFDSFSYQSFPYQPPQTSYSWPICASAPPPFPESFDLVLPNQTLGLNLNLQDFDDLDTTLFQSHYIPPPFYSPASPSTSSSPPISITREETPYVGLSQAPLVVDPGVGVEGDLGLHHAMGDDEMAEIRALGEQHQIEWDDTMDMVTSSWWFNFFNTMDIDTNSLHQSMEFPPWLNANDNCSEQLDEQDSGCYFQDPTQMDIGDVERMDGEW